MADRQPEKGRSIHVRVNEHEAVICGSCLDEISPEDVVMFLRPKWDDVFDGICYSCAKTIIQAASDSLEVQALLS